MSPDAHPSIPPESASSSSLDARPSTVRVPRMLFWFSAAVLAWFLISEGATEAWYRWKESQVAVSEPWSIDWPTGETAARRGFMGFQSRQLGEAEKEILRFDHSAVASWRDIKGNQWSAFYLEWGEDHRLNQNDVIHNPTVCLPAAGLRYIRSLPDFIFKYKEFELRFKTWEFELAGRPVFVYVASRWRQEFDMYDYKRGAIPRRLGNLWKALVGNRGNPLQTLELVVVGPTRAAEVSELVDLQLQKLFGEPND